MSTDDPTRNRRRVQAPDWHDAALADLVARLRRAMRRAARISDPSNALSVAQLELLSCLAEQPGARPSELARLLRLAPNSVTTLVNGLRSRRLVRRGTDDRDRRAVSLTLTRAGVEAVQRWQTTNATILRQARSALPPAQQRLLDEAFPALRELIGAIDALAGHPASHSGGQRRVGPVTADDGS